MRSVASLSSRSASANSPRCVARTLFAANRVM